MFWLGDIICKWCFDDVEINSGHAQHYGSSVISLYMAIVLWTEKLVCILDPGSFHGLVTDQLSTAST